MIPLSRELWISTPSPVGTVVSTPPPSLAARNVREPIRPGSRSTTSVDQPCP